MSDPSTSPESSPPVPLKPGQDVGLSTDRISMEIHDSVAFHHNDGREAGDRFCEEYHVELQRITRAMRVSTRGLGHDRDTMDFYQSVMIRLVKTYFGREDALKDRQSVIGLLRTIAGSVLRDWGRRATTRRNDRRRDVDVNRLPAANSADTPSRVLMVKELREQVLQATRPVDREIAGRICDGETYEEISCVVGKSSEAVRKTWKRALRRIAENLACSSTVRIMLRRSS